MTTLEEILKTLQLWKLEASNHHNDGWVMQGYSDKLQQVWDELSSYSSSHFSEVKEKNN
jgi:hypothetical protein